jgi:mannose-6-phosphate isomerase-like protein (cupin superfamily)
LQGGKSDALSKFKEEWKMFKNGRRMTVVLGLLMIQLLHPATSRLFAHAQGLTETATLQTTLPEGVTISSFASESVALLQESYGLIVSLERLPFQPGERLQGRDPEQGAPRPEITSLDLQLAVGPHLLFAGEGELVVEEAGRVEPLPPGWFMVVPEGTEYEVHNPSNERCSVLMRLSANSFGSMGSSVASEEVPNLPLTCGEPELLFTSRGDNILGPKALFLAELTWDAGVQGSALCPQYAHIGPVGIVVESGFLTSADEFEEGTQSPWFQLGPGSAIAVETNSPYRSCNLGTEDASVLMAGVVATNQPLWQQSEFFSMTFAKTIEAEGTDQTLSAEPNGVNFAIVSEDAGNFILLPGACYLLNIGPGQIEGCDVNNDGQVQFKNVPPGSYSVTETRQPEGYRPGYAVATTEQLEPNGSLLIEVTGGVRSIIVRHQGKRQ